MAGYSSAAAQTLVIDTLDFTDRRLAIYADVFGTEDVSNCSFKIRAFESKAKLNSPGLGQLIYIFNGINYNQFPVTSGYGSGFSTD